MNVKKSFGVIKKRGVNIENFIWRAEGGKLYKKLLLWKVILKMLKTFLKTFQRIKNLNIFIHESRTWLDGVIALERLENQII